MKSSEVEIALIESPWAPFYCRRWLVVPNVHWGWGLRYEADLIAISDAKYAYEIEIKVSKSDLLRDIEKDKWKRHGFKTNKIKGFYYAVPKSLEAVALAWKEMPEVAGLISVENGDHYGACKTLKKPEINKDAKKLEPHDISGLHRLAYLRYWSIRKTNQDLEKELKDLRKSKK